MKKTSIGNQFDFIYLCVGYVERLTKTNLAYEHTEKSFFKTKNKGVSRHVANLKDFISLFYELDEAGLVGIYEYDDKKEVYDSEADVLVNKFKDAGLDPSECVVIMFKRVDEDEDTESIYLSLGIEVVKKIRLLEHCGCLDETCFTDIEVYEFEGKTICKLLYDTESG